MSCDIYYDELNCYIKDVYKDYERNSQRQDLHTMLNNHEKQDFHTTNFQYRFIKVFIIINLMYKLDNVYCFASLIPLG